MEKDNAAVQLRRDNDVLIAAVSGEIDHHSAAGIRRAIDSAISAETPDKSGRTHHENISHGRP